MTVQVPAARWQRHEGGALLVMCPLCNHVNALEHPRVTADGLVISPRASCATPGCGQTEQLKLDGWAA